MIRTGSSTALLFFNYLILFSVDTLYAVVIFFFFGERKMGQRKWIFGTIFTYIGDGGRWELVTYFLTWLIGRVDLRFGGRGS